MIINKIESLIPRNIQCPTSRTPRGGIHKHFKYPSDIEVSGNHFFKPLTWKVDDPSYLGTPWTVKNIFELKNY